MDFKGLFQKKELFFAVDVGASSVKVVEFDLTGGRPRLIHSSSAPLTGEVFTSNSISQSQKVADKINSILDNHNVGSKRAVVAVPGPSVFTKRIKMAKASDEELDTNVQFEAGSFIPHNINAVKLDYHVLGESTKNQLDVLVVAVKNEIIDSYLDTLGIAGVNVGIVDVDYFALQNVFELNYPEYFQSNVALVNIGARYSAINICRDGQPLFTGDISVGGRQFTEALAEGLGLSVEEAEKLKRGKIADSPNSEAARDVLKKSVEEAAIELNRQLSFFWSSTGSDEGIDKIMLCGGGSLTVGLVEELQERTGIECELLDPFRAVERTGEASTDEERVYGIAAGLALREFGDKVKPILN